MGRRANPVGGSGADASLRSGVLADTRELGANCIGGGVADVVEDGEGMLPAVTCGVGLTGDVLGVPELGEGLGFGVSVAGISGQARAW